MLRKFRNTERRAVAGVVSAVVLLSATAAWAAVGLPYTFQISGLSGGSSGVSTPTFFSNNDGRICIDSDLVLNTNSDYRGGAKTGDYNANLIHVKWGPDALVWEFNLNANSDGSKTCVVNVPKNVEMKMDFKKDTFEKGVILDGGGVISYS